MTTKRLLTRLLVFLFLGISFSLYSAGVVRKEVRLFSTFEDFVNNRPLKVYPTENEFRSDKRNKKGHIIVFKEKTANGKTLAASFHIPPIHQEKYLRLNEFGFKQADSTKKKIVVYDSLDNFYRKRALKVYNSKDCETNVYNDSNFVFKHHKANLIKVTYYYNRYSNHIYQTIYRIPKILLNDFLNKSVAVGVMSAQHAELLKQKQDEHITIKFDYRPKYLDATREKAIEMKYTRQSSTAGSTRAVAPDPGQFSPYYLHLDGQGSVVAVTDRAGELLERVTYSTYGVPTFWDYTQGATPVKRSRSVVGNDLLFQGRRYDYETGLYYFRNRFYDPRVGRFLQTDPLGYVDSLNLYQAFNNNPPNFRDPLGKQHFPSNEVLLIKNRISGLEDTILKALANPRTKPQQAINFLDAYSNLYDKYGNDSNYQFSLKGLLKVERDFVLQTDRKQVERFFNQIYKELAIIYGSVIAGEMMGAPIFNQMLKGMGAASKTASVADDIARAGKAAITTIDDVAKVGSNYIDDVSMTRVGRWMSKSEYQQMLNSGFVQKSHGHITHVTYPANPEAFKAAKSGSVFVEFDVPTSSIVPGGKEGWGIIPGPGSIYDKLKIRKGFPGYKMPKAKNIKVVKRR
jgi:RHS repeat-associated protein